MNHFKPNCYVEVGLDGVRTKIKALGMYRGVMRPYPHPRSEECTTGLAAYRGSQFQLEYAEAFEVVLRKGRGCGRLGRWRAFRGKPV